VVFVPLVKTFSSGFPHFVFFIYNVGIYKFDTSFHWAGLYMVRFLKILFY